MGLKMSNKKDEVVTLLHAAYEEVKDTDNDFAKMLLEAYQKIQKGENYKIICSKIALPCNRYVLAHLKNISKNVGKLNTLVQEIRKQYLMMEDIALGPFWG